MDYKSLLASDRVLGGIGALVVLIAGIFLARFVSRSVVKLSQKHFTPHEQMIARKASYYIIMAITIVSSLHQMGINLSVILGAAGLVTVAVGFAAQTSTSNLISGIFIILERPFMVGDTIKVSGNTGEVVSIGLLSTIIKSPDNLMIRIPNETMMKSEITNVTRYPIRRLDLKFGVAYKENLDRVRRVLLDLAKRHELILDQPAPQLSFLAFGASSLDLQYSVWVKREDFTELSFVLPEQVKALFEQERIDIPYPHCKVLVEGTPPLLPPPPVRA